MKRQLTDERILDAMTADTRRHQHASAAAHHWKDDPELAQDLLGGAIRYGAQADALLDGWTWKDALAWLFGGER